MEEAVNKVFQVGFVMGFIVGAMVVATFWVLSTPHIDAMPDLELNPCMGWGTTDGKEFAPPSDQYYNSLCVNRTPMGDAGFSDRSMHVEEACRCYEYKNWWKYVKPPSMFR